MSLVKSHMRGGHAVKSYNRGKGSSVVMTPEKIKFAEKMKAQRAYAVAKGNIRGKVQPISGRGKFQNVGNMPARVPKRIGSMMKQARSISSRSSAVRAMYAARMKNQ